MSREAEWVRPLAKGVRKRHWHRLDRGKVIAFAVQLEVLMEKKWQPIVRYDAAHGFAHRDVYETRSRKRKEPLGLDFAEALTLADRDIDRGWRRHVERFRRGVKS